MEPVCGLSAVTSFLPIIPIIPHQKKKKKKKKEKKKKKRCFLPSLRRIWCEQLLDFFKILFILSVHPTPCLLLQLPTETFHLICLRGTVGCLRTQCLSPLCCCFPGEAFYETSPYEPIHFSEEFRHASIISGKPPPLVLSSHAPPPPPNWPPPPLRASSGESRGGEIPQEYKSSAAD